MWSGFYTIISEGKKWKALSSVICIKKKALGDIFPQEIQRDSKICLLQSEE